MKRGTDHFWKICQYRGDTAWYARCKCGYKYVCSRTIYEQDTNSFKTYFSWIARYCPSCGARKRRYNEVPIKLNQYPF